MSIGAFENAKRPMNPESLSKKHLLLTILAAVVLKLAGFQSLADSVVPANLQCEYRVNPLGIDVTQPRLTWQVQSTGRDQGQSAYEILAADSKDLLDDSQGDMWDSGRISSDETVNLVYSGKPLASGAQCFWKVRVWDKNGRPSAWSEPAMWSIGLLKPEDWQGQWIGSDQGETKSEFSGAKWIWFPEGNPAESAPVGTRYFRRVFEVPSNQVIRAATIAMTADDQFRLFVNGQEAGNGNGWGSPKKIALGAMLKPGKNVLSVEARNVGSQPNPAGLIGKLNILFEQGDTFTLDTGDNWKSATNADGGWNALAFDDSTWVTAKVLGEYGTQSWGIIENEDRQLPARYLRREFSLDKKIRRATAYVCGLGLFELYLNDHKISDDVLSPALSEYGKRAFYLTFDATDQLKRGNNAIGVILGNGRFFSPRSGMQTFGCPKLLLQLNVEYTDGSMAQIVSDDRWKLTVAGPIRADNEYDGEEYDARLEMPGWCQPNFDDSNWQRAQLVEPGAPVLSAQIGEPIRVVDTIRPVAIGNPKPGVYIFDLGQNIGGWCRLKVRGPQGTVIKLRHGETLMPDGTLYTDNLRTAKAEDIYTLNGKSVETYEPRFT